MKPLIALMTVITLLTFSAMAETASLTPGTVEDRGFVLDNVLHDSDRGDIHFSLYVPDSYDGRRQIPLYIALPGWEGLHFQGVGADLRWETLPFAAREYQPEMIIASAQLNDWGMTSALDAIALTEYLLSAYAIDPNRVYLSGLSGGGETGSLVMGIRPELFAAYLMVASQWDGDLEALAASRTPMYMIIGEDDSYYGSSSLMQAYQALCQIYRSQGLSDEETEQLVVLNVKDAAWFEARGYSDQHAGAIAFSYEPGMLPWFFSKHKGDQ